MNSYDPAFETDLPPPLTSTQDTASALYSAMGLPLLLRIQGMRAVNFVGAAVVTNDDGMRSTAIFAIERALTGYRNVTSLFRSHTDRTDLNPAVAKLLTLGRTDDDATHEGIAGLESAISDALSRAQGRGAPLDGDVYDALLLKLYDPFHPAILGLSARIEEAAVEVRADLSRFADEARAKASTSRGRIEEIARTVRLISLNARVEAARAGEHGVAFGVIAEEIKSLSEQTEQASSDMGQSVDEIMVHFRGM